MKKILLIMILFLANMMADAAVQEYVLKNGLKIWIKPDHRSPVVVSMIWYKVGGAYEPPGLTGISHMLEHMMFKGSAHYPGQSFTELISQHGGQENAFTDNDYTAYYEELSKQYLPLALSLEADRMHALTLSDSEFQKEIQVVKEERFMRTDDNPTMLSMERLNAAAYLNTPYHHPTVGWLSDLNQLTINNVRDWYHAWYGPNNATIVIVGDVDPAAVKKLIERDFGGLKPIALTALKKLPEPPFYSQRQVQVQVPAQLPWLALAYNVPSLKTAEDPKEAYALLVLSQILGGGNSSRLAKTIVRQKQVASSADTSYNIATLMSTLLYVTGVPATGHSTAELQQALLAEVEKLKNEPVTAQELERVKNSAIADQIFQRDSLTDQASELGILASLNLPWQLSDQFIAAISAVTAKEVQDAARKYLIADRMTIAQLIPLPMRPGSKVVQTQSIKETGHVH